MPSFLRPGLRKIRKSAADVFSQPVRRFLEGQKEMFLCANPPVGAGDSPCGGLNEDSPQMPICWRARFPVAMIGKG